MNDKLLTTREVADLLGMSWRSIERFRLDGRGPAYIRVSASCIRYELRAVLSWIDANRRRSTSDTGRAAA